MTDLAEENASLRIRIEELEFELSEMRAVSDGVKVVKMGQVLGLSPKAARLAFILSDAMFHSRNSIVYRLDLEYRSDRNVDTHINSLRRAGLAIKVIWGKGYEMSPESCLRVRALMTDVSASSGVPDAKL